MSEREKKQSCEHWGWHQTTRTHDSCQTIRSWLTTCQHQARLFTLELWLRCKPGESNLRWLDHVWWLVRVTLVASPDPDPTRTDAFLSKRHQFLMPFHHHVTKSFWSLNLTWWWQTIIFSHVIQAPLFTKLMRCFFFFFYVITSHASLWRMWGGRPGGKSRRSVSCKGADQDNLDDNLEDNLERGLRSERWVELSGRTNILEISHS